MGVLIVTNEQDLGADHVVLELERRGVPVLRCNAERLPDWHVALRPGIAWSMRDRRDRTASSEATSGVWWRRPSPPEFGLPARQEQTLVAQWQAFVEGLASVPGPEWVSRPFAISSSEDKARQLATAQRVGLSVPETVWTNEIHRARDMLDGRGVAVVKSVTAAHWEDDQEAAFVFARSFTHDDLPADATSFAAVPAVIQHIIGSKRDIRVTVAGEATLAAEASRTTELDWRLEPETTWRPHSLPLNVADLCRAVVSELGLRFGGIDLVLDEDGIYWFLEINPNGEWAWLQAQGLQIASAIADVLTDGDR